MIDIDSLRLDFPFVENEFLIKEIYPLAGNKLSEIVQRISLVIGPHSLILKQNGLEIYGRYRMDKYEGVYLYCSYGMIVAGSHLKREPSQIYLITFKPNYERDMLIKQEYNLVDLLRKHII